MKKTFACLPAALVTSLISSALPASSFAASFDTQSQIHMKLFDSTVTLPQPNWQKGKDATRESKVSRRVNDKSFLMEFVPKGQNFTNWKRLYAIRADKTPQISLTDTYKNQVNIYANVCTNKNLKRQVLEQDKSHVLFVLICTDSPNGPKAIGYGPGVGEVAVFWIGRHRGKIVKIFHHWRGQSFDYAQQGSWPVGKRKVQQVIKKFGAIRLF